MDVRVVTFDVVYPVWRDKLWNGRETKIEPSNPIDYLGKYNPEIMKNYPVSFACYDGDEVIGVNTLLPTSETYCRSRGLYINLEQRLKGVGRALMEKTLDYATFLGFEYIWSMPRKEALPFYLKFDFKQTSEFDDQYEFGPNCFILKEL